jgi:alkanesulfonate monooxygenase SsuD/methylene tetrahydromethanopterin reductase-like flavin-dependent oxidoreductase (luciferase family)
MFNSFAAPWEWGAVNAELDTLLAERGRDATSLERTAFVFAELSGDRTAEDALVAHFQRNRGGTDDEVRRRVLVGSAQQMVDVLGSYAAAGIDMAILNLRPPFPLDGLERFAADVLPQVRDLAAAPR